MVYGAHKHHALSVHCTRAVCLERLDFQARLCPDAQGISLPVAYLRRPLDKESTVDTPSGTGACLKAKL